MSAAVRRKVETEYSWTGPPSLRSLELLLFYPTVFSGGRVRWRQIPRPRFVAVVSGQRAAQPRMDLTRQKTRLPICVILPIDVIYCIVSSYCTQRRGVKTAFEKKRKKREFEFESAVSYILSIRASVVFRPLSSLERLLQREIRQRADEHA